MEQATGQWVLYPKEMKAQWSEVTRDIAGVPHDIEVGPAYLQTIVEPDDWEKVYASLMQTAQHGTEHNIVYRINRPLDKKTSMGTLQGLSR